MDEIHQEGGDEHISQEEDYGYNHVFSPFFAPTYTEGGSYSEADNMALIANIAGLSVKNGKQVVEEVYQSHQSNGYN